MNDKFFRLASRFSNPNISLSQQKDLRGKLTGEFRAPKKGEWYLSGAIPECYQAPNDLSIKFNIVKIVTTKTTITTGEVF